ncbi:double-strand break repair protein AddB [Stappia stellulata]|uniref:double-strand break repair protein AddB n=1 Tax=Stappia stellulata TaxID=71235 RepID=UPI00041CEAA6|nr:double-strand break repair protein AddB [Stappia stellulata]
MSARRQPNIFSIPPSAPFLPTFVDALLAGRLVPGLDAETDPLALARITLYVPTRRAARALPALFQARLGRNATLLPVIRALGDVDEDIHLLRNDGADLDLPPALPEMHRKMAMARLVHAWEGALRREVLELGADAVLRTPASAADAAWLAGDLLALMDEMETEEVPWSGLAQLVPEDHARYWQITLDFLKIAMTYWPAHLADRGAMNPKARRSALIRREAQRLRETPPAGPVIVAGATGSVPATADLLRAVADLAQGAIVLPGFDMELDDPSWEAILGGGGAEGDRAGKADAGGVPSHPQYGMAHVVVGLGVARADIVPLAAGSLRDRIVGEALRPAETTDAWPVLAARISDAERAHAFDGVDLLAARNEAEEALAVAIVLRRAVADGHSAALITPDRTLARRVAIELRRWGLQADDSAGRPLDQTPPGVLARLAAGLALDGLEPVPLLALLKHPLVRLGLPANEVRAAARALERAVLRGPRARSGTLGLLDGVRAARGLAEDAGAGGRMPRWKRLHGEDWDVVENLVVRLSEALAPLEGFAVDAGEDAGAEADAVTLARAHEEVLRRLCRNEAGDHGELYAGEAGDALAAAFAEIFDASEAGLAIPVRDWPDVFIALLSGLNVRRRLPGDPRIAILGPMEARLQPFDVVVLGALNEGSWPQRTRNDPWLNRPMKRGIGLDPPERRIGAAAHDFIQGLGAGRVILSRSERSDGAPTVASRWILRLTTLLGGAQTQAMRARGDRWLALARSMDRPAHPPQPAKRPAPTPPVAARPARLSVTAIETLIRDPYAIYARDVLKLDPVDPIGGDPGAAEKGTLIHDILADFLESWSDRAFDAQAHDRLLEIGRQRFAVVDAFPAIRAIWWLRFTRIAAAFLRNEGAWAAEIAKRHLEIGGTLDLDLAPGRIVTLSARADRIDLRRDGTYAVIDYKTGQAPSAKEVAALLAPQLPLEAAMVTGGAFPGVDPSVPVGNLLYLRLAGGRVPLEVAERAPKEGEVDALAAEALARTKSLFAGYENPQTGYLSRARVMKEREFAAPYDHLARVREWALDSGEDR